MQVEVPTILETQLTGRIGGASVMRGRVTYRVNLVAGQRPICLIDGRDVEPTHNVTMTRLVTSARKFFGA